MLNPGCPWFCAWCSQWLLRTGKETRYILVLLLRLSQRSLCIPWMSWRSSWSYCTVLWRRWCNMQEYHNASKYKSDRFTDIPQTLVVYKMTYHVSLGMLNSALFYTSALFRSATVEITLPLEPWYNTKAVSTPAGRRQHVSTDRVSSWICNMRHRHSPSPWWQVPAARRNNHVIYILAMLLTESRTSPCR